MRAATDEMFDKIVEINVKAALRLIRLIVPRMIERKSGSIINIASVSGLRPQPGGLLYSFTKAGLIMMTRSWAQEFGPHGKPFLRPAVDETRQEVHDTMERVFAEQLRLTLGVKTAVRFRRFA